MNNLYHQVDNYYQDANAAGENCVEVALAGGDGEGEVDGEDDEEVGHDDEEQEVDDEEEEEYGKEGGDICSDMVVAEFDQAVHRLREAGIQVISNCNCMQCS